MAQVYLSLGTNIDRQRNLANGLDALEQLFTPLSLSSLFESEAVGFDGSPFFNMVVGFQTDLAIEPLSQCLRELEYANGRERETKKFSPRSLDLDILLYDDLKLSSPVQLPRDEITYNAFVLWPLSEIAADVRHPITQQTYAAMWHSFDKTSQQLTKVPLMWSSQRKER